MTFDLLSRIMGSTQTDVKPQDTWTKEEVELLIECIKAKDSLDVIHEKLCGRHSADAISLKIGDLEREMLEKQYNQENSPSVEVQESTQTHLQLETDEGNYSKYDFLKIAFDKEYDSSNNRCVSYCNHMINYMKKTYPNVKTTMINKRLCYILNTQELENIIAHIKFTFTENLDLTMEYINTLSPGSKAYALSKQMSRCNKDTKEHNVINDTVSKSVEKTCTPAKARTSVQATKVYHNADPVQHALYSQVKEALSTLQSILSVKDNLSNVNVDIQKNSAGITFTWD